MKTQINIKPISIATFTLLASVLVSPCVLAADLEASSANPSIFFDDTDAAGIDSWRIEATEDAAGNGFFGISDFTGVGGFNGFVLRFAAANGSSNTANSLVVDSSGDINLANGDVFIDRSADIMGIGTTTPNTGLGFTSSQAKLHLKSTTGFAGLIQENNNSAWLRDVGAGGTWISRLQPNFAAGVMKLYIDSPANSITANNVGVGIGLAIPTAKLDVAGDIKTTFVGPNTTSGLVELLKMSANNTTAGQFSDAGFSMENARAGFSWAFRTQENTGGFAASKQGTGAKEFEVRNTTNVAENVELFLANGARNVGGQWLNASSRSYKKNIHDLSNEEAMQTLRSLKSVKYQFKRDESNQQMVGFIAEDVPALLATKDRKTVDPLQIVAVLTKALQQQDESLQAEIKAKDAKIADMEQRLSAFEIFRQRLDKIEANLKLP